MLTEEELEFKRKMILLEYEKNPINDIVLEMTHYTSPKGFEGIIEKESLWATRFDCLNDITEREDAKPIYDEVVDELSKQDSFYEKFKNIEPSNRYEWLFHDEENNLTGLKAIEEPEIFVISFSNNSDSISMWNYYCKNNQYQGYALTFHKKEDFDYLNLGTNLKILNMNLIYNDIEKRKMIKEFLEKIKFVYFDTENCLSYARAVVSRFLSKLRDLFKNHHFEHEQEHRILIIQDAKKRRFELDYRECQGLMIPYIKFPYKEYFDLACVTCAPLQNNEKAQILTKEYLSSKGYPNTEVKHSTIPIRY